MREYRNVKTGVRIIVDSEIKGGAWEEILPTPTKVEEKAEVEKPEKTPVVKKRTK